MNTIKEALEGRQDRREWMFDWAIIAGVVCALAGLASILIS